MNGISGTNIQTTTPTVSISSTSSGTFGVSTNNACNTPTPVVTSGAVVYGTPDANLFTVVRNDPGNDPYMAPFQLYDMKIIGNLQRATKYYFQLASTNGATLTTFPPAQNIARIATQQGFGSFTIQGKLENACGQSVFNSGSFYQNCGGFFRVAPNPATTTLTIDMSELVNASLVPEKIMLLDEKAEEKRSVNLSSSKMASDSKIVIDVKDLPRGKYFLHSITPNHPKKESQVQKQQILLID